MDLRTRYSELTTLTSQYIKFISETLRRMEEEEVWPLEVGVSRCPDAALGGPFVTTWLSPPLPLPDATGAPP